MAALMVGGMDGRGDAWPKYRGLSMGGHGGDATVC